MLNSTAGAAWVNETLENLRERNVYICDEEILTVSFCLASVRETSIENIKVILSKDKAVEQCRKFLASLRSVKIIYENSTSAAAKKLMSNSERTEKETATAAIVSKKAAEIYGLKILKENIQDVNPNRTKFIVISRKDSEKNADSKTSIMFEFNSDMSITEKPGMLYEVIKEFAENEISMAYLQSIPKNGSLNDFTFYCEIVGHRKSPRIAKTFNNIKNKKTISFWKVLGSYPPCS